MAKAGEGSRTQTYSSNSGESSLGKDLCNMLRILRWRSLFNCISFFFAQRFVELDTRLNGGHKHEMVKSKRRPARP
jgi:hypothetical protein